MLSVPVWRGLWEEGCVRCPELLLLTRTRCIGTSVVHLLSNVGGLELVAAGAGAEHEFSIARQYARTSSSLTCMQSSALRQ